MNHFAVFFAFLVASIVGAVEFAPTAVAPPQFKTTPPSETQQQFQYVQTVYKETDHKTLLHTVEPLQPSYVVKYQSTSYSTINNQTIKTESVEFATVVNTTVLYNSEDMQLYTYVGAPTYYQTLEFATQKVEYTPIKDNTTGPVTVTETNALPFI
ncbi:uncharacterized protein LOC135199963 [Macrobrachium nipponense]|uniref:uncharacterized protein LOC135199963 n=1 Tax=Macrobrachium nipponense TaxID=159736 RepID=UPI0030C82729